MTNTIRYPLPANTPSQRSEADQIISLGTGLASLPRSGGTFANVTAWQFDGIQNESPYVGVVIEIVGTATTLLGDGTLAQAIGLFGKLSTNPAVTDRYLLGLLGYPLGGVMPQIPLYQSGGAANIACAFMTCNVALYTNLAIGGVFGDVAVGAGTVSVTARPVRRRDFIG